MGELKVLVTGRGCLLCARGEGIILKGVSVIDRAKSLGPSQHTRGLSVEHFKSCCGRAGGIISQGDTMLRAHDTAQQ